MSGEVIKNMLEALTFARAAERESLIQTFLDPQNQPTQYGTVTLECMRSEIAAEREACAKACEQAIRRVHHQRMFGRIVSLDSIPAAIRARGESK